MYTLVVGAVRIHFSSAVIKVRREITHHDWRGGEHAYARQEIDILQHQGHAVVTGRSGTDRDRWPNVVRVLSPSVRTHVALARHLAHTDQYTTEEKFLAAMVLTDYEWGRLAEIDWTALDYAPGGLHYYLLPRAHPVIDLGGLTLDWPSITVTPA